MVIAGELFRQVGTLTVSRIPLQTLNLGHLVFVLFRNMFIFNMFLQSTNRGVKL